MNQQEPMFEPRCSQMEVMNYRGGKLGVSAVPGSGKTYTLSALAAKLLREGALKDDQEILIVTLVNSAVDNFTNRIQKFMQSYGLIPNVGYRVRTLHGLAHDIVREKPDLAGLANDFTIADERETFDLLARITQGWLYDHPGFVTKWLISESASAQRLAQKSFSDTLVSVAGNFIRVAKDERLSSIQLSTKIAKLSSPDDLLQFGSDIYTEYQRMLNQRGLVDFDDLIRLALQVLQTDIDYLERVRHRWAYILEDESQDSSRLQEMILRQLSGPAGNWVRVGDPNQAIFETFTTASPEYLKNFLNEPGVNYVPLPESGRSALPIIELANRLILWTKDAHPIVELREALTVPLIQPTRPGDPQQNPPAEGSCVVLVEQGSTPEQEIIKVARNIKAYLEKNPQRTIAVLTTRNERGEKMIDALQSMKIPHLELLRSTQSTRTVVSIIASVLACLEIPNSSQRVAEAYRLIREYQNDYERTDEGTDIHQVSEWLRKSPNIDEFFYPSSDFPDPIRRQKRAHTIPEPRELELVRAIFTLWHEASILPIGQIVLLIGQEIFTNPADLGLVYKLSRHLTTLQRSDPFMVLKDHLSALSSIAKNQRKFLGFSDLDTGFDPDSHPGKVVVATIHKSKGLEWDRVYLLSVNNYDFPSAQPEDEYFSEKWFIKNRMNIEAETMHRLRSFLHDRIPDLYLPEGTATGLARLEYCSERLRLLYVGITRARRELVITWNTGKNNNSVLALPIQELFIKEKGL